MHPHCITQQCGLFRERHLSSSGLITQKTQIALHALSQQRILRIQNPSKIFSRQDDSSAGVQRGVFTNESHCASKSFLHAGISTLTLCSFSAPAEPSYLRRMLPNMPTRCNFPATSGARSNATARGCRAGGNERHGLFCAADKLNHRRYAVFPECSRIPAHIAPGHPLFMRVTSAVVQDSRSDQDAVSKRRFFQNFFADRSAGNRVPCVGENHFQIPLVRLSQKHDRPQKSSISLPNPYAE